MVLSLLKLSPAHITCETMSGNASSLLPYILLFLTEWYDSGKFRNDDSPVVSPAVVDTTTTHRIVCHRKITVVVPTQNEDVRHRRLLLGRWFKVIICESCSCDHTAENGPNNFVVPEVSFFYLVIGPNRLSFTGFLIGTKFTVHRLCKVKSNLSRELYHITSHRSHYYL